MYKFPIGALMNMLLWGDKKSAIEAISKTGIDGIQLYMVRDLSPENLVGDKKTEFIKLVEGSGLTVSALCGDAKKNFADKEQAADIIEHLKRVLYLSKEFKTNIVTTHIGTIPEDEGCESYKIMQETCGKIARFAEDIGAYLAIETGPETALVLKNFMDSLNSRGIAANLDPANFVMVTGDDPVEAVYTLKDYIVHTHAKDGKKLVNQDKPYDEFPFGKGDVDFPKYLNALDEIGYTGYLTIEREYGDDPYAEIKRCADFLKNIIY